MKKNKTVILICLCAIVLSAFNIAKSINLIKISTNSSSHDYNIIKYTYESMFKNIKSKNDYEALEQDLQSKIKNLNFLNTLNQDEILAILEECTKEGKLNVSNIAFSDIRQFSLNKENQPESIESFNVSSFPIEVMDVYIEFSSTYENMILFVNKLQSNRIEIIITKINILNEDEGEKVCCTIDLTFYAVKMV